MECPVCHLVFPDSVQECPNCHYNFAKQQDSNLPPPPFEEMTIQSNGLDLTIGPDSYASQFQGEPQNFYQDSIPVAGVPSRYKISRLLGSGGFSNVYLALDTKMWNRKVAVKHIVAENLMTMAGSKGSTGDIAGKLMAEPQALANLQHPNIVYIYDVGVNEKGLYIITEYVDGGTLKEKVIKEGPLDPDFVIDMGIKLCNALEIVHQKNIVHRDIKPGNILLTHSGEPKLADFGLLLNQSTSTLEKLGSISGTFEFMSPEQVRDSVQIDARSDIFSLGATLFYAASRKHYSTNELNRLTDILKTPLQKALKENPLERYASAGEFKKALEKNLKVNQTRSAHSDQTSEYPCYSCGKMVPYVAVFCHFCGQDLVEIRKNYEQKFVRTKKSVEDLVAKGDFETAKKEISSILNEFKHEHLLRFKNEGESLLKWTDKEHDNAVKLQGEMKHKLKRAKEALNNRNYDNVKALLNDILANSKVFFQKEIEEAQSIFKDLKEILNNFNELENILADARGYGKNNDFKNALSLLDKTIRYDEKIYGKYIKTAKELSAQFSKAEKESAIRVIIKETNQAIEKKEFEKAIMSADSVINSKEPFLKAYREQAEDLLSKATILLNKKKEIQYLSKNAENFAQERNYQDAIKELNKILNRDDLYFEDEKKAAGAKIKNYQKLDQEEILKKANLIFDGAKDNYHRNKRDLLDIMDNKKEFLSDFKDSVYKYFKEQHTKSITRYVLISTFIIILIVILGYLPGSIVNGEGLLVLSKKANMRSGPDTNHPIIATFFRGDKLTAKSYRLSPAGNPWIKVKSDVGGQTGYISAILLGKTPWKLFFEKGRIVKDEIFVRESPEQNSGVKEILRKGQYLTIERVHQIPNTDFLAYEISGNGFIDLGDIQLLPPAESSTLSSISDYFPYSILLGSSVILFFMYAGYQKLKFLSVIRSKIQKKT